MPRHIKIADRAYDFEPRPVLRQSAIAKMKKTRNLFDDQKRIFNPGSDFRLRSVLRIINFGPGFIPRSAFIGH